MQGIVMTANQNVSIFVGGRAAEDWLAAVKLPYLKNFQKISQDKS